MPRSIKLPLKKQKTFQRLQDLLQQPGRHDLLWYHRVGEQVNRLYPTDDRGYGESHMPTLAEALRKPASYADTLWKSRLFWNKYDRPEVRLLCKPEVPGGFVLTWAHIVLLISMDDEDRLEFQEKCIHPLLHGPASFCQVAQTASQDEVIAGPRHARILVARWS
jgi:hypothetical protein